MPRAIWDTTFRAVPQTTHLELRKGVTCYLAETLTKRHHERPELAYDDMLSFVLQKQGLELTMGYAELIERKVTEREIQEYLAGGESTAIILRIPQHRDTGEFNNY